MVEARLLPQIGRSLSRPRNVSATSSGTSVRGDRAVASGAASVALGKSEAGAAAEPKATVTKPSGSPPREPVTAYVRNAQRGEVTVMAGKHETTYHDPALAKRLIDAAGGAIK